MNLMNNAALSQAQQDPRGHGQGIAKGPQTNGLILDEGPLDSRCSCPPACYTPDETMGMIIIAPWHMPE